MRIATVVVVRPFSLINHPKESGVLENIPSQISRSSVHHVGKSHQDAGEMGTVSGNGIPPDD
jgi:hypothetical protein